MSKPRRQPGPIKRTIYVPPAPSTSPAANLVLRAVTVASAPAPVRRTPRAKLTGAQLDARGNYSDWNRPATLKPFSTPMTPAWDYSATTMPRGGVSDPTAYPTH